MSLLLAGTVALHAAPFGEITITRYTGSGGDVTIPETIEGLPVTSVTIGHSVSNIDLLMFQGCARLTGAYSPGRPPEGQWKQDMGYCPALIVYYRPGTPGWGPEFVGHPTIYFRTVPGKQYGVQRAETLDGPWNTTAVVTATTTQKRFVFDKAANLAFYRLILAQ